MKTSATVALPRLLAIGLIAGTLDIGDNLIYNATRAITPAQVFRYICAGLTGPAEAARLGAAGVALGVVLHYLIAFTWTVVFYAASRKLVFLLRRPVLWGVVYGAIAYAFMNLVVVPHSSVPHLHSVVTTANRVNGVLALLFCIGATIAVLTRRWLPATTELS